MPNYLIDYLHLDLNQMGLVLSAIGIGASLGTVIMPSLSDHIGRKPVMLISVLGAIFFLTMLSNTGAEPAKLFFYVFGTHFFNFALITLTVGPLSAEAVPARLMATASGLVIGVGEIFGGSFARSSPASSPSTTASSMCCSPLAAAVGLIVGAFGEKPPAPASAPQSRRTDQRRKQAKPFPTNDRFGNGACDGAVHQ